jgi:hypothetical protein
MMSDAWLVSGAIASVGNGTKAEGIIVIVKHLQRAVRILRE